MIRRPKKFTAYKHELEDIAYLERLDRESDGLCHTFICIQPRPAGNLAVALIQLGKTYLRVASPVASGCATMITGTAGSKNWYIQGKSKE